MDTSAFITIDLPTLLNEIGETAVKKLFADYKSAHTSDTEDYLQTKAIMMEKRGLSRTYLVLNKDTGEILGYTTVGLKCLKVPTDNILSKSVIKNMNVDPSTGVAQSYLLGQLSRSENTPPGFGTILLNLAMNAIQIAMCSVGCRIVRLDCRSDLISYYVDKGFKLVTPAKNDELNKMIISIDDPRLAQ